jgi:uncharacterized protein (UPF0218 family)
LPTKRLTEGLRTELKNPIGLLLVEKDKTTAKYLRKILEGQKLGKTIVVGDCTAKRIIKNGLIADVYIIDNRIMRRPTSPVNLELEQTIHVTNPAGMITEEAWRAVEEAIRSEKRTKLVIHGEEDLLALPAILSSPIGSLVLYGQPKKGLVVVEVTEKKKLEISRIIDRMEEV